MKNFKVVFAFLPVLLLVTFIYFSTVGFSKFNGERAISTNKIDKTVEKRTSSTVFLWINLIDINGEGCVGGAVSYCIDGYTLQYTYGSSFSIEVPCDRYFTICLQTEKCSGSWSGSVGCNSETFINVNVNSSNGPCICL